MSTSPTPCPELERAQALLDSRINWEKRARGAMRVDTASSRDLCRRLGDPQLSFRTVHVGGTKGKGSVASLVSAGLRAAGYRVGTFLSPHVERLTERVLVEGLEVESAVLAAGIDAALNAREQAEADGTPAGEATWFDLFTAAAFHSLRASGVEWAVIEVGLGGRLDSTNVLEPALTILTTIDLEHTAILGSTRRLIAGEKAGILRPGVPFVCGVVPMGGEDDPGDELARRARELGIEPHLVASTGTMAAHNLALAKTGLDVLGASGVTLRGGGSTLTGDLLDPRTAEAARLPGRQEARLGPQGVPVLLDGAHVASSVAALLRDVSTRAELPGRPSVVLALAKDKDHAAILKALAPVADSVWSTSVPSGIHLEAEDLAQLVEHAGIRSEGAHEPREALHRAAARAATSGGWVLVTGSLYVVGAVRSWTSRLEPLDPPPCSP